ncbi:MYND-type domain-containing protein [Mycena sanguinolenta]|uniref:MYND-type domain-containing protein n=1 Tax=Mycena sanguinolenta TaxID=230812 RepID=A0A8H6YE76_9AGAR|nr:MYND-type domain-containing protein [Mycena sanguinolenta]
MQRKPWPAWIGLACHNCFKQMDVQLFKCSGCRRISYCGRGCQNSDWKKHKDMCKALSSLEQNPFAATELISLLPTEPITDVSKLAKLALQQANVYSKYLHGPIEIENRGSWVQWEPRCIVCTRTDMVIRMEAAVKGKTVHDTMHLIPCPECKLSFCCSHAHWDIAHRLHYDPCDDLRDGRSQCYMNKLAHGQSMIGACCLDSSEGHFVWIPNRIKPGWVSLEGQSWEGEFGDFRKILEMPQSTASTFVMAAISDTLTMPMTILYALCKLSGDEWTRKQMLTVHIVGASSREFFCGRVFEEILHRTPQVKTLKIVMCGPEAPNHNTLNPEICSDCIKRGRSYVLEFIPEAYHDFVRKQGSDFKHPDLCIGFNSGANYSRVCGYTWPATFKVLVEHKIPSLITAYNRQDAEADAALLRAAGAALHPGLGPVLNPWGSLKGAPSPHNVHGFLVNSGWLAGGFK